MIEGSERGCDKEWNQGARRTFHRLTYYRLSARYVAQEHLPMVWIVICEPALSDSAEQFRLTRDGFGCRTLRAFNHRFHTQGVVDRIATDAVREHDK